MRLWYVGFMPQSGGNRLFGLFIRRRPQFGHVFCFAPYGEGKGGDIRFLQLVEPCGWGVSLQLLKHNKPDVFARNLALHGVRIVKIYLPTPQSRFIAAQSVNNWIPSCVTLVKACLGVPFKAITPYGLYRELLKKGGEEVAAEEHSC